MLCNVTCHLHHSACHFAEELEAGRVALQAGLDIGAQCSLANTLWARYEDLHWLQELNADCDV